MRSRRLPSAAAVGIKISKETVFAWCVRRQIGSGLPRPCSLPECPGPLSELVNGTRAPRSLSGRPECAVEIRERPRGLQIASMAFR